MPRRARPSGPNTRSARSPKQRTARSSAPARRDEGSPAPTPGPFVLGAIPGATPGKWIDAWQERMPRNPLELRALDVAEQRDALISGGVDAALVRLPIDRSDLHVIPLYDEVLAAWNLAAREVIGERSGGKGVRNGTKLFGGLQPLKILSLTGMG